MRSHQALLFAALAFFFTAFASPPAARAGIIYNESVSGDLSNDQTAPTVVNITSGTNTVIGSVDGTADFQDWLTFTVPSGYELTSLVNTSFVSTDTLGFTGIGLGSAFDGSSYDPGAYLGYTHFGPTTRMST